VSRAGEGGGRRDGGKTLEAKFWAERAGEVARRNPSHVSLVRMGPGERPSMRVVCVLPRSGSKEWKKGRVQGAVTDGSEREKKISGEAEAAAPRAWDFVCWQRIDLV
jgi:hypothetical protein